MLEVTSNQRVVLSNAGWYRVARTSNAGKGIGKSGILIVEREYNTGYSESYTFSISLTYSDPPSVTQLSGNFQGGSTGHKISKIRICYSGENIAYIDLYYTGGGINAVGVMSMGYMPIYETFETATVPSGYSSYEFDTIKGFKASHTGT